MPSLCGEKNDYSPQTCGEYASYSRCLRQVDEWTSRQVACEERQGNIVSGQVDQLTSESVAYYKEKTCSDVTLSPFTSNLLTRLLPSITSNLLTRLTCQLVNFRKDNSQIENQKGVNSVQINALLACKRCPLRPLLTPFWNPIKPLLVCSFVTYWFSVSCKLAF